MFEPSELPLDRAVLVAISFPHSLILRALAGAAAGLLAWWFAPTAWAVGAAVTAPFRQRKEARDFRLWALRRLLILRERHQTDMDITVCSFQDITREDVARQR